MESIEKFRNIYKGQDVWVVGSGSSVNYIDPSFFDGKNTIVDEGRKLEALKRERGMKR